MSALMYSQMGMSAIGAWGGYQSASIKAGLDEKMQEYRNAMNRLGAARSQNAVTVNEVRTRDAAIGRDQMIQRVAMKDQAAAEVQAAAAGVAGNSVDTLMKDLKASAGRATYANRREVNQRMAEFNNQRTTIAIGAITGQDVQVIPRPSVGSMLLGAGTNLLNIYDNAQPEGSRILE